jgi:hypothetical protein
MKNSILLFLITIFSLNVVGQKTPTFKQYEVKIEKKIAKKVLLTSHSKAKMFRTNLREALATNEVNFAGKYIIAEWGCGSGCSQFGIIDAKTGKVFFPDILYQVLVDYNCSGLSFKKNSTMIIIDGYPGNGDDEVDVAKRGISYYQWTGTDFKLLKFIKKPIPKLN